MNGSFIMSMLIVFIVATQFHFLFSYLRLNMLLFFKMFPNMKKRQMDIGFQRLSLNLGQAYLTPGVIFVGAIGVRDTNMISI